MCFCILLSDNDDSKNRGGYISKYVANIDGLTRKELFYGYQKENTLLDNSKLQVCYNKYRRQYVVYGEHQRFYNSLK